VIAHPRETRAGISGWQLVLLVGSAVSLLLATLAWSLVSTRERAIALGNSMGKRFRTSEERFRKLNELLPCLVLLARKHDGHIVYRNAFARARLVENTGWIGLSAALDPEIDSRLNSDDDDSDVMRAVDVQIHGIDGQQFWASTWINSIEIDGVPMWLLVASDISEQRQLTERLSYQASHDSLTRLFNRREFESRAQALIARNDRSDGALLFIDLDQFKLINDTSGHRAGDELLVQLAAVMREKLRPEDVLGRLGGDEFGVLLAGASTVEDAMHSSSVGSSAPTW
ncbi:MAG: diguanylate cyclase, partial [Pseudomonadota bacterium]|nr:diguanylate cyclase [Pseudomonadota bacterium]